MALVVRSNYGDESLALIAYLSTLDLGSFSKRFCVYIDTGWSAHGWDQKVEKGESIAQSLGFTPLRLASSYSFGQSVQDRKRFPSKKFQWCAGFLKGLPLLDWLDENDPELNWTVAIAKRQELYRQSIPAEIKECPHHGERKVWHPMVGLNRYQRDAYLERIGIKPSGGRSLECQPCVNSQGHELLKMDPQDVEKTLQLEQSIQDSMYPPGLFGPGQTLQHAIRWLVQNPPLHPAKRMDAFTMGCGDPFGCGL